MTEDERDTYEHIACRECGAMLRYISELHLQSDRCSGRFRYPSDYKEYYQVPVFAPAVRERL